MALIVQKYGGTSLETPEKIKRVAQRIKALKKESHDLIVVVSAMGHTTDQLLDLAAQVSKRPHRRELDMLLTAGERISMSLLAMALNADGVPAISLTGSQSGIMTSRHHGSALIDSIKPIRIEKYLREGKVVLVAGFQGVSSDKEITTLGRGGSDTTAVALAAHFHASRCEILTDVEGLFEADPRIIMKAKKIDRCSSATLLRFAAFGAKVMHPRAAALAKHFRVPLWIGHSEHVSAGTEVGGTMEQDVIRGITGIKDIVMVRISIPLNQERLLEKTLDDLNQEFATIPVLSFRTRSSDRIDSILGFAEVTPADIKRSFGSFQDGTSNVSISHDQSFVAIAGLQTQASPNESHLQALQQKGIEPTLMLAQPHELFFVVASEHFELAQVALYESLQSTSQGLEARL